MFFSAVGLIAVGLVAREDCTEYITKSLHVKLVLGLGSCLPQPAMDTPFVSGKDKANKISSYV